MEFGRDGFEPDDIQPEEGRRFVDHIGAELLPGALVGYAEEGEVEVAFVVVVPAGAGTEDEDLLGGELPNSAVNDAVD